MNTNMKFVAPEKVKKWLDINSAVLVDVRSHKEYELEYIAQASHTPANANNLDELISVSNSKAIVFHCASGIRSVNVCEYYMSVTGAENSYVMGGDIEGWKNAGFATIARQG